MTNGSDTRSASGAGRWFPGTKAELKHVVDGYIAGAGPAQVPGRIVSAIAPHAGYVYSGPVAGFTFRAIKDNARATGFPETVVVLGSSHHAAFRGVAVMDGSGLHTPLGTMALDSSAAELLAAAGNRIRLDYGPHCGEHSAENQVPFVQSLFPSAGLVAALVGDHDIQTLRDLVDALGKLAERRSILVVSSSDMLHDADYELVSRTDRETLKKVAAMDYDSLAAEWSPYRQTFCGLIPALAAMRFAASRGCREGTVLHYCNSGDIDPSGRGTWVVGYGAVVFAVPAQSG